MTANARGSGRGRRIALRARSREFADVFEKNEKENKTTSVYRLNIHERFFSLLKDEQQLSINDFELTSLGKAKSILPHKVKPKQRDVYLHATSSCKKVLIMILCTLPEIYL